MSGAFFACPQHALKVWYFGKWEISLVHACRPTQFNGAEFFLQNWYVATSSQNMFCFYGPQALLPQSQKPTTVPSTEAIQLTLHWHILFL
jgi:hypothetical protein